MTDDEPQLFATDNGFKHWQMPDHAPGRVRTDDYETSKAGAASVAYRAGSQKARLMTAYTATLPLGYTDEEAAIVAGISMTSCYWKRCNELREAGLIEPTGEVRTGRAGVPRMVCRAKGGR